MSTGYMQRRNPFRSLFSRVPSLAGLAAGDVAVGIAADATKGTRLQLQTDINGEVYSLGRHCSGNGSADDSDAFEDAIREAFAAKRKLVLPPPLVAYTITRPLTIDQTMIADAAGLCIEGIGGPRQVKILYTGTGYFLTISGDGAEGGSPITRFFLRNMWLYGGGAGSTATGALSIKRTYQATCEDIIATGWGGASAVVLQIQNTFNFKWSGGQIACGFPDGSGLHCVEVGSANPDAWNTSNVTFFNTLMQYAGQEALKVSQGANLFDNLLIEQVSFGKNAGGSILCNSGSVNNITIRNNHFESAGLVEDGDATLADVEHIDITSASNVHVLNNSFQDAKIHCLLTSCGSFRFELNKVFESGGYTIAASTGLKCVGSTGAVGQNAIFSEIDTPYDIDSTSRVSHGFVAASEAQWSSVYAAAQATYKNAVIHRHELRDGSSTEGYSQFWLTDGTQWFRQVVSLREVGEATAMPTTGSYTAGDFVRNIGASLTTPVASGIKYFVLGWHRLTTGTGHTLDTDWFTVVVWNKPMFVAPPATSTSTGIIGQYSQDATYVYRCYATNTWSRDAHSTAAWP